VKAGEEFTFGKAMEIKESGTLRFAFEGTEALLLLSASSGTLAASIDDGPVSIFNAPLPTRLPLAQNLPAGRHTIEITATGPITIDGFIIRNRLNLAPPLTLILLGIFMGIAWFARRSK
jgi:hypothetical protein